MTKLIKCNCKNDYQDAKYGNNMRVHNKTVKFDITKDCRCTVCSKINKGE